MDLAAGLERWAADFRSKNNRKFHRANKEAFK
jgi:hypothetical protein